MSRRKPIEEPVNHERWLVSYADFITLLFAFFVVMYSLSSLNEGKYRIMSNSVLMAFGRFKAATDNVESSTPQQNPGPGAGAGNGVGSGPGPGLSELKHKPSSGEPLRQEREKMTGLAHGILSALAPLIREGKVAQMYSSIQTGSSMGMQTLDQSLSDLVKRNIISLPEARGKAKVPENFASL